MLLEGIRDTPLTPHIPEDNSKSVIELLND